MVVTKGKKHISFLSFYFFVIIKADATDNIHKNNRNLVECNPRSMIYFGS